MMAHVRVIQTDDAGRLFAVLSRRLHRPAVDGQLALADGNAHSVAIFDAAGPVPAWLVLKHALQ